MKKIVPLMMAMLIVLGICGCQTASSKPLYGIILTEENSYLKKILEGFQTGAEELGTQVIVKYAATVEEQISTIEALEEQGVKAIAIRPAETEGLEQAFDRAEKAGIPVLCVDMDTKNSRYFVNQVDFETVAKTLLDAILDLSGGDGEFAVISSAKASGMDIWVNSMEHSFQDKKYENLTWVETEYCFSYRTDDIQETTEQLLADHPDLKVICCTDSYILKYCSQTVDEGGSAVRTTGLSSPSVMTGLLDLDKACPYFFFWNPVDIGYCCAYAAEAAIRGGIGPESGSFTAKNGNVYATVGDGLYSETVIYVGPPYQFTAENYYLWTEIF